MKNTEVLVHISAPSGARDDARYRAQVEAILGFEAVSRHNVMGSGAGEEGKGEGGSGAGGEIGGRERNDDATSSAKEVISVSSSTNSSSGQDRQKANSGDELRDVSSEQSTSQESSHPDPEIVDEQERRLSLDYTASDRAKEEKVIPLLPSSSASAIVAPSDPTGHQNYASISAGLRAPQQSEPRRDSLGSPVSVIPDSQPAEGASPKTKGLPELELASSNHGASPTPIQYYYSSPAKRRRVESPVTTDRKGNTERNGTTSTEFSEKDKTESEKRDKKDHQQQHENKHGPSSNQSLITTISSSTETVHLQIHPPPPETSTDPFVTHITPTLQMLSTRLKPSRTYRPLRQTRDIDDLERGYWFIRIDLAITSTTTATTTVASKEEKEREKERDGSTSTFGKNRWDLNSFSRFWTFLSDFISKDGGRAGWGVWCILEDDTTSTTRANSAQQPRFTSKSLFLKVYTWGEVVMHVYLLLFLASERRIRGLGAQWRDCREEVVVQMV